jgi:pyruvate,orthophosphate dikinase
MFFEGDRIKAMREMILAETDKAAREGPEKLLPYQREDFEGIFKAMKGLPVTIRLLDPPLHEFLPHDDAQQKEMAKPHERAGGEGQAARRAAARDEPHARPPRLPPLVTYPEILEMQVTAIIEAACNVRAQQDQGAARDHGPARRHQEAELDFCEPIIRRPRRSHQGRKTKVTSWSAP